MLSALTISDVLEKTEQKRLLECCNSDVAADAFFDDVLRIISIQARYVVYENAPPVKVSKAWMSQVRKARKLRSKAEVERKIQQTLHFLEELPPQVINHIGLNGPGAYEDMLDALKRPYEHEKRLSPRQLLIKKMRCLIATYGIESDRNLNGDLVCMLEIICDASGVSYDIDRLARDIIIAGIPQ